MRARPELEASSVTVDHGVHGSPHEIGTEYRHPERAVRLPDQILRRRLLAEIRLERDGTPPRPVLDARRRDGRVYVATGPSADGPDLRPVRPGEDDRQRAGHERAGDPTPERDRKPHRRTRLWRCEQG